jgi:hypothetical protein
MENGIHQRSLVRAAFTKAEIKRFIAAVTRAALIEIRKEEHGTLRRFRGGRENLGLPGCKCDACSTYARERVYGYMGYTPKMGEAAYRDAIKELGRFLGPGETIEQALEEKRRQTDGSK